MIVYIIGPGRHFSLWARRVIQGGGLPLGGPLVAGVEDSDENLHLRLQMLEKADVVFLSPGWGDELSGVVERWHASQWGKVVTDKMSMLLDFISEEVRDDELLLEGAPVVSVGERVYTRIQ